MHEYSNMQFNMAQNFIFERTFLEKLKSVSRARYILVSEMGHPGYYFLYHDFFSLIINE